MIISMEAAEAATTNFGPRYAPDDPTLPKPWKGLLDGTSGVLYYWNPETNVTQYEKPVSVPPPLPPGPSPASSPPKLLPIPVAHSVKSNGLMAEHGQQMSQVPQPQPVSQHGQTMSQKQSTLGTQMAHHQQSSQMAQTGQQLSSQLRQATQQHGPVTQMQMMHHLGQQMPQDLMQPLPQQSIQQSLHQPGKQFYQPTINQLPQRLEQQMPQNQGSQMAKPPAHQFAHQQLQYMTYEHSMHPHGQQSSQPPSQHNVQGQSFANQHEYKAVFAKREEEDFQSRNQIIFSPSQHPQAGVSAVQNISASACSAQMPQIEVHSGQSQQFGGSLQNMQTSSMGQLRPSGTDLVNHSHGTRFLNERDPSVMHSQHSNIPSVGLRMGHETNLHGKGGNDKGGPIMGPQQPMLAAIPMARAQQEMRKDGVPFPNAGADFGPGDFNSAGHTVPNMYNRSPPFPNSAVVNPSYVRSTNVCGLSPAEVYRQQHEVTATGDNVPAPFASFEAAGFPHEILREIYSAGFTSPTPIQAQTWPIAFQGSDIVAIAKTGSGKTLGYLIPAFMLLRQRRNNPQHGPTVLVLAPTRELATQIQDEVIKFGRSSRVCCTCLYGGAPKGPQLKELEHGADIVVATPGRLNDILEMKKIAFGQVSLLVLDEADRMLDMGFEPQIRKIVNEIPPHRQTLMYTATWPKDVRKIASDLLVNPVQVNIGSVDELAANKAITQYVEVVPQMEKQRRLEQILRAQERGSKVIIFCSTKRLCDQLARSIGRNFGAAVIHGDKSQGERDWVLNQFRSGKSPVLVATDVAARGLDIKDIRLAHFLHIYPIETCGRDGEKIHFVCDHDLDEMVVINYDFPTGVEDYVHRIGRTGRAGATGVAYTFFSEQDWKYAADLIKVLEGANQHVPPEVRDIAMRGGPGFGKERGQMSRFDGAGPGRWDSGGRGGMRDGGFSGRGVMRDGNFGGRGSPRDLGFGGRGGPRDGGMPSHGCRGDFFPGRGNRGRCFGGPGGGQAGWGRNERPISDRYSNMDTWGRGRGRGRFENRRDFSGRSRVRNHSRSPERVRTWGYSRSPSCSRSHSRSKSRSRGRSWSRGRSHSYSRSPSRSWSRGRNQSYSRSRSRSRSYERPPRQSKFDIKEPEVTQPEVPPRSGVTLVSPGIQSNAVPEAKLVGLIPALENAEPVHPDVGRDTHLIK